MISRITSCFIRLEIQHTVRRLRRRIAAADSDCINSLRLSLATEMAKLKELQTAANVPDMPLSPIILDDEAMWDEDADAEEDGIGADSPQQTAMVTGFVEGITLPMPSNRNVPEHFGPTELALRKEQASNELNCLRGLIADKSFQYSHVIRNAPTKKVRTRAQTKVKTLDTEILFHCRLYSRCRSRLIILCADADTMGKFQTLTKEHIKASSAVLNPNIAGSTRLQLSWLWRSSYMARDPTVLGGQNADANADADADFAQDPTSLLECVYNLLHYLRYLTVPEVKRVHWLRARAQCHRWKEELTLVNHEMVWTVRYFLFKSNWWESASATVGITAGAAAYARRKKAMWRDLALMADRQYQHVTNSYNSPM